MKNGNGFVSDKDTEQFLRTLVEKSVDGIMVIDSEGVVRFANPSAKVLFQNEIPELEGYHFGTLAVKENVEITIPHDGQRRTIELRATDITWQGQAAQLAMLRDITDRVGVEAELRERERLLRETNEMARVGGWALDLETGEVWWSQVTREIHEVPEDFTPHLDEALKFFPQPGREKLAKAIAHTRETGEPYDLELPFISYRDTHIWTRALGIAEFQGEALAELHGTFQDITERKEAELALRESERQFRQLFEHDINGFALMEVVTNEDGGIESFIFKEVNRAFEEFLSLNREDVTGKPALEVFPALHETDLRQNIGEVFLSGESKQFDYYSKSYQKYFNFSIYKPLPGQIAVIFNDITEQKQAEEAMRHSEEKYRTLYETMALGAIYVTKDLQIHSVNPAAEEILGLSKAEIEGRKYTDSAWDPINLDGEPLSDEERPSVKALREGARVEDFVYGIYNPEKEKFVWINVNAVPQFREGEKEPYRAFSTFSDISGRIESERMLRKSEKKFRTLFKEMAQGVVYQNAKGEITSANSAAERILGLSHDQLLGKKSIDEDWQAIRRNGEPLPGEQHPAMVSLRTGERVEGFIFGIKTPKRKETVWIYVSSVPQFREGEDEPYQVFTTFLDITDRIRIQKVLEERVKELRSINKVSAFIQQEKTTAEICQETAEALISAMQYPDLARAKIQLAGETFDQEGWTDGLKNSLEVPIEFRGENHGYIKVCYLDEKKFFYPEEGELLENLAGRLASYHDRQQTHEQLQESEERFRRAFRDAPIPIMIHAEDGEVININDAWTEISGYDLEEIPTVADWIEKAYGPRKEVTQKVVQRLYAQKDQTEEGKFTIQTKNGQERTWLFSSAPLGETPDGRRLVISMATDITERVAVQENLETSEERFRTAIFDAPYPIMIHAEDGEVLVLNDAWTEGSGYSAEEIQTLADWTAKAFRGQGDEVLANIRQKYLEETKLDEMEMTILTAQDERRIWQFTTSALGRTPDGRKTAITIAKDISAQEWYLERLMALSEIDRTLNETLDLDEVLNRITTQLNRIIDFKSMSVMLIKKDVLRVIAGQGFDSSEEVIGLEVQMDPQYPNYKVIEKRKPIAYENVQEAFPAFAQPLIDEGGMTEIKSWMGVPLIREGEVIGIFTIDRVEINPFTEEEIEIAMQYGTRAAIAINNAQLYERIRQQLGQLDILREIDSVINISLTLDDSLPVILRHVQKGLDVDAAAILLYDKDSQELVVENTIGLKSELHEKITIQLGHGFSGQVAETREPVFVPEVVYEDGTASFPVNFEHEEIVSYYGFPLVTKGELIGIINLYHRSNLEPGQEWVDFAHTLAGQVAITIDNITLFTHLQWANEDLREAYDKTIEGWANALEMRDQETAGHSQRVVALSIEVAKRFGFKDEELPHLRRGILLHDIGKMGIPDKILHKPGPLTEEEWVVMRRHPVFAYNMVKDIDYLKPALNIPHYHHERWDGSGYPEGLAGEEIPLEARIFMVVDIWDALTSDRSYRDAWSEEKTINYLKEQAGKELDPEVVAVTLEIIQEARN